MERKAGFVVYDTLGSSLIKRMTDGLTFTLPYNFVQLTQHKILVTAYLPLLNSTAQADHETTELLT